jgi:archaellum component FlaG (FlaF/FlaG flagellin family)
MNTALLLGITVILIFAAVLGFILYSAYQASKAWSEFGKQMSAMLEAKRKNDAR